MIKQKLSYLGHHEKAEFLEKDNNAGKIEGSKKRRSPNKRWSDSINEAMTHRHEFTGAERGC